MVRVEGSALYAQDTRTEVALAGVAFIDIRALGAGGAMFSSNGSTHNTEALDESHRQTAGNKTALYTKQNTESQISTILHIHAR